MAPLLAAFLAEAGGRLLNKTPPAFTPPVMGQGMQSQFAPAADTFSLSNVLLDAFMGKKGKKKAVVPAMAMATPSLYRQGITFGEPVT